MRPEAAIKRSVEYDCYIYAWNSAGTVEGVDITMVWNTLLLLLQCGFKCADKVLLADWWREVRGLMWPVICRLVHGKNRQGLEPLWTE